MAAAHAAFEQKNYERAIREARAALAWRPGDSQAQRLLSEAQKGQREEQHHAQGLETAQARLAAGDYAGAVELLKLIVQGWPEDARAKELLAQAQKAAGGAPGPAEREAQPPPENSQKSQRAQADHARALEIAQSRMAAGDYAGAIDLLNLIVRGWPDDARAKELLVQAQQAVSHQPAYERAMSAARRALVSGDYGTAMAQAKDALAERPGDAAAKALLLQVTERQHPFAEREHDNAEREHVPGPATSPPDGYATAMAAGQHAFKAGDYDGAMARAKDALAARPGDAAAKALLLQATEREHVSGVAPSTPGGYMAAMAAGQHAFEAGDYDGAIAQANLALTARPGDKSAGDLLARAQDRKMATTSKPSVPTAAAGPPTNHVPEISALGPPPGKGGVWNNEISAAGDFLLGEGTVTLPVGYSLNKSAASGASQGPVSVNRSSEYFGGSVSYSHGPDQTWFIDFSYVQGNSSGSQSISTLGLGSVNSNFSIKDEWYQAYIRYTFPGLEFKTYRAYARVGATYVTAKLQDNAVLPAATFLGRYTQTDNTDDILGNLGGGIIWFPRFATTRKYKVGLQAEGEGFFGYRSQKSLETLTADADLNFVTADISNTLYGGVGRATVRFQYGPGHIKAFADGGFQARYTLITYPGAGTQHELLDGPYVRLGLRYDF